MPLHRTQWEPRDFVGYFTVRVFANECHCVTVRQAIGRIIGKYNVILITLVYDAGVAHANRFGRLEVDALASESRL